MLELEAGRPLVRDRPGRVVVGDLEAEVALPFIEADQPGRAGLGRAERAAAGAGRRCRLAEGDHDPRHHEQPDQGARDDPDQDLAVDAGPDRAAWGRRRRRGDVRAHGPPPAGRDFGSASSEIPQRVQKFAAGVARPQFAQTISSPRPASRASSRRPTWITTRSHTRATAAIAASTTSAAQMASSICTTAA